ncbi:glycosyltransferase family 4 protein [Candidatus Woesearchaeota archaeon]|jgi:glycosyltransferase involved in cell wall biosynthesis|nr:glycosyltransferase family 4 protein [Candidatus Woesearchaeota archaeon]MBT7296717.1 glycosyltransferase family 4 protein [Candidatus Woesearchaeota archaeon]
MKILFISEYFPPKGKGGGEISCFLLAKYLVKQGVEIHVLTSKFKETKKEEIIEGIHIHRLATTGENPSSIFSNIKRDVSFAKSIKNKTRQLIKKHNFDIIHYFNINSIKGIIKTKIPKIIHINSPVLFCPKGDLLFNGKIECATHCNYNAFSICFKNSKNIGKLKNTTILKYNPIFKKYLYNAYIKKINLLKQFNYFTPISNYLVKKLQIQNINNISVIPNIVETEKFIKNNSKKDKLRIIYLGGYTEFKGIFTLINALKRLKKEYTCDIYGSGELKNKIKTNNQNIKFHGPINHKKIPELLSNYNILVFPSIIPEAFGRVAIEAMAAGCLPIASRIGGITDIITDKKNGYFFTPGNSKELAKILNKLDLNKIKTETLVRESKKYSGEIISKKVKSIYKNLIK